MSISTLFQRAGFGVALTIAATTTANAALIGGIGAPPDDPGYFRVGAVADTGYSNSSWVTRSNSDHHTVSLEGFDSTQGVLTGVSFRLRTYITYSAMFAAKDPTFCQYFCEDDAQGYGSMSGFVGVTLPGQADTFHYAWLYKAFSADLYCAGDGLSGCMSTNWGDPATLGDQSLLIDDAALLATFIDQPILIGVHAWASTQTGECSDDEDLCRTQSISRISGIIDIEYQFEAFADDPAGVASPGTLALLSGGLVWLRRRDLKNETRG